MDKVKDALELEIYTLLNPEFGMNPAEIQGEKLIGARAEKEEEES
ncbi:hypothetical protein [Sediminibacillus albus]|uniref:Uncharacterized protein n=1 Tax=Sediminibacillus albus TaxID=407036 RepID=A0A1G8XDX7_9BACI|nr:hypothetical protein [Sediminibacillus albus]SDJ88135.1 hypothetical protein SAMN05216243_1282 [Sediminibacillus albus]